MTKEGTQWGKKSWVERPGALGTQCATSYLSHPGKTAGLPKA